MNLPTAGSFLWQGYQYVNGTFDELENVDVREIRELLDSEPEKDTLHYNKANQEQKMSIVDQARDYERKYHEELYGNHELFEPGSWLYKPAAYVLESFELIDKHIDISSNNTWQGWQLEDRTSTAHVFTEVSIRQIRELLDD